MSKNQKSTPQSSSKENGTKGHRAFATDSAEGISKMKPVVGSRRPKKDSK